MVVAGDGVETRLCACLAKEGIVEGRHGRGDAGNCGGECVFHAGLIVEPELGIRLARDDIWVRRVAYVHA